jgi:hypothetical protein
MGSFPHDVRGRIVGSWVGCKAPSWCEGREPDLVGGWRVQISYRQTMKVITGTVVHGKVEVPDSFAEGAHVMILATETSGPIRLTPQEEEELVTAMDEIRRGEFIDGQDLIDELRSQLRP